MSLLINRLEKIQGSKELTPFVRKTIDILLNSINDWPQPIIDIDKYDEEICALIGGDVNKIGLENYIKKIDYSKHAWEAESLCQLLSIFDYYEEGKLLKEIIRDIQAKIENMQV